MSIKFRYAALALMLISGAAFACKCFEFTHASVVMATPTMGAAYVSLVSEKDDTLTSLSSDCCDAVELHTTTNENGVMKMRKLEKLDLKAGVPVEIMGEGKGDALHLMLIGVKHAYKPGQNISITFHFAKESPHKTSFKVVTRAAKMHADAAGADAMGGMDMGHDAAMPGMH